MPTAPAKLPACLLSPTYLGVHELAALGDEVVLDGGLRIYSGSATESSSSAAHAMASGCVPGSPLLAWVPQGSKEQSSGIEGIYLRATLRTPLGDIGSEKSAHMWLELDAPGVGTPERLRKIGPYRLRVLRVWETEQGSALSEPAERTVSVRLAVDKVRIHTTRRPNACARGVHPRSIKRRSTPLKPQQSS